MTGGPLFPWGGEVGAAPSGQRAPCRHVIERARAPPAGGSHAVAARSTLSAGGYQPMNRRTWTWVLAAAALGLAACGDDDDDDGGGAAAPGPSPATCTPPATATVFFHDDVHPVLTSRCIPCHGDTATSLPKYGSADRTTAYTAARAAADTANPASSRLVTRPNGAQGHPDQLDDAQTATIARWIQECAQNNSRDVTATTTR